MADLNKKALIEIIAEEKEFYCNGDSSTSSCYSYF